MLELYLMGTMHEEFNNRGVDCWLATSETICEIVVFSVEKKLMITSLTLETTISQYLFQVKYQLFQKLQEFYVVNLTWCHYNLHME